MANKKNSKSNKKSKDSKAPKRYRSSYILFSLDKRQQIKVDLQKKTNLFILFIYFSLKIQDYHRKKLYLNLVLYGKLLILR